MKFLPFIFISFLTIRDILASFIFPREETFSRTFSKKIYWHQDLVTLHWAKAQKPFFSPEETFLQKFVGTDDNPPPLPPPHHKRLSISVGFAGV